MGSIHPGADLRRAHLCVLLLVGRRPAWGFEMLVVAGLVPGFPVRLRPGCDELFLMMDIHQILGYLDVQNWISRLGYGLERNKHKL